MSLLDEAIRFAVEKHSGQIRKISGSPFILHPLEVLCIVSTMTNDVDVLVTAVLHDTVEDTDATIEEIEEKFGKRVAFLVGSETENKMKSLSLAESWKIRKIESLKVLEKTEDIAVKMLWLADKLSNIRSFYREISKGRNIFEGLNQNNPAEHAWYYRSVIERLSVLKDCVAYKELVSLTDKVFEEF